MAQLGRDRVGTTRPGRTVIALWARTQLGGGVHDKDVCTTEEFCCDREIFVETDLDRA